ncbi:protein WVD2-like 7 isoform X2 [Phragmites australis]|uniref:protein WVD2-like 7 isoform X2 n=1 Tax=Phragmites australis TaxID=29695 RepID=UPI002D78727F|nr:protein WVD2-like 7 isoform X2 [Phragmites australis]
MAAEVGHQFSGWSYSDLPHNDHITQDALVQQMVHDHGSVSFGRFAAETLSWEKRSVFAHNRRQEELSKLTAPGLVAQKKAFFEEYYKRARHLKAQGAVNQTEATLEERNDDNTLGHSSQADQLPAVISEDPVSTSPSSTFEPSTEVCSSDERKCHDAHELGYLTFNPLFSQTASLQNSQLEDRSSSGKKQFLDREFPCATHTSSNLGLSCEALERKVLELRRVVSNDNDENNVAGSRIVLPRESLQSEGLKLDPDKRGARKNVASVNRSTKRSKDLSTSVIHIPRVDVKRNSENRPSQDLKDPFHTRVQMKLRALSDRMNADRDAVTSRSASYQPPDRATISRRSSYQNADRLATSSGSSLSQNTLAPSRSAAQASHKSPKGVQRADALHRGILFNKGSRASHVASSNSTATGKSAAKVLVMPTSQVSAKNSGTAQVTLKRAAGLTSVNNGSQNKRKQLSTPAALDENNPKRGYARISAPPSTRSSSDNLPPAAKAPNISNRNNVAKKPRSAGHPVGGRSILTKRSVNCNDQNRKVTSTRTGSLAGSSMRSDLTGGPSLTKNKPRQERPRWR